MTHRKLPSGSPEKRPRGLEFKPHTPLPLFESLYYILSNARHPLLHKYTGAQPRLVCDLHGRPDAAGRQEIGKEQAAKQSKQDHLRSSQ